MIEMKDLDKLSMNDLVNYYNATKVLKEHYANEAHMNQCYQNTKEKHLFEEPLAKQMKCNVIESKIMNEFEKRLINN